MPISVCAIEKLSDGSKPPGFPTKREGTGVSGLRAATAASPWLREASDSSGRRNGGVSRPEPTEDSHRDLG